jgi:hypothetical protein
MDNSMPIVARWNPEVLEIEPVFLNVPEPNIAGNIGARMDL